MVLMADMEQHPTDGELYSEVGLEAWMKSIKAWPVPKDRKEYLRNHVADNRELREAIWKAVNIDRDGKLDDRVMAAAGYRPGRNYGKTKNPAIADREQQETPDQKALRLTTADITNRPEPRPRPKYPDDRVMTWEEFRVIFQRLVLNSPPPGKGRERQDRLESMMDTYWEHMQKVTPANFDRGVTTYLKNPDPYLPKLGVFRQVMIEAMPPEQPKRPTKERQELSDEALIRELMAAWKENGDSCKDPRLRGMLESIGSLPPDVEKDLSGLPGTADADGDES